MKNFKDNQKVTHPKYGEGVIKFHPLQALYYVTFSETSRTWNSIGDDFYSQLEAVEDLPNVGEYAYFWDDEMIEKKAVIYGKLGEIDKEDKRPYYCIGAACYNFISKTPPKFD
jgi:hypothetical protein